MSDILFAIHAAIEFIDAHLKEDINVADMATASSYSLYHFERTFNRAVHHTPYDYLIRRRLSEAARCLICEDKRITDLALEYRFHNIETFSRAFKRMFGVQPNYYRITKSIDPHRLLTPRTLAHLQTIQLGDFLHPHMLDLGGMRLVGYMTRLQNDRSALPDLWSLLHEEVDAADRCYGVMSYPKDWVQNGAFYFAAVEVHSAQIISPALVTLDIPAASYACFEHPGTGQDIDLTRDYIYQTWLPRTGMQPGMSVDIEVYESFQQIEQRCKVYLPLGKKVIDIE
jgi:AraC family transcriptional regulator